MTKSFSFPLCLLLTCLALPAFAQSAVVGRLHTNGTIELYNDRFQDHFEDGTAIARLEVGRTGETPTVTRWAADGCRSETTALQVTAQAVGGWRPLAIAEAQPLSIYRCEDRGCAVHSHFYFGILASCKPALGNPCHCVQANEQVLSASLCERVNRLAVVDLSRWILAQFIQ